MPPRLLLKSQCFTSRDYTISSDAVILPESTQESQDDIVRDTEDEIESEHYHQPQASRNFEFVNSSGGALANAISRPSIRSHVMREANRIRYLPSTGHSSVSSSGTGPQVPGPSQIQVQKFKIGPSGLRPMLPSKRSRRGQTKSSQSSPSKLNADCDDDSENSEGPMTAGAGAHDFQDRYSLGCELLDSPNLAGAKMNPFDPFPIPLTDRTEELLLHCKSDVLLSSSHTVSAIYDIRSMGQTFNLNPLLTLLYQTRLG